MECVHTGHHEYCATLSFYKTMASIKIKSILEVFVRPMCRVSTGTVCLGLYFN